MASKATRKMTEALSDLLEAYSELLEGLHEEFGTEDSEAEEGAAATSPEMESGLVNEVRAAVELVMDQDDYTADDIASLITSMTEALEEIDPSIFEQVDEEEEAEEIEVDEDDEDDDDDYLVEEDEYDDYDEDYEDSYEDIDDD